MHSPVTFLIADDDPTVLTTLNTAIIQNFDGAVVYLAEDGGEALSIAQRCFPDIIISDLTMPALNGIELCKALKSDPALKNSFFTLLTAHDTTDFHEQAKEAFVDEYITKPFSLEKIIDLLKSTIQTLKGKSWDELLKDENSFGDDYIDNKYIDYIALVSEIIICRMPETADILKRIAQNAKWISEHFSELSSNEIKDLETAARFALLGKISLPDSLVHLPVITDGNYTHELMNQVPTSAQQIVNVVPILERVGKILRHIFENMDGSGFPDRLQAWQIPLASRIIRVCLDFEEIKRITKKNSNDVLAFMNKDAKRLYDIRMLILLDQYISIKENTDETITPTALQDLKEGMVLARDVITSAGLKLVPSGAILTSAITQRIISHNLSDPIIGKIYIKQ